VPRPPSTRESRTYGITSLRKSHVRVPGNRIAFDFRAKHRTVVRTTLVDDESEREAKRVIPAVMRQVGKESGNTPAVARSSYVSPAVIDQYLDGRTSDGFRPRHLRVVRASDIDLDPGRTSPLEPASFMENPAVESSRLIPGAFS
jgi:DNA topoisomerase IB